MKLCATPAALLLAAMLMSSCDRETPRSEVSTPSPATDDSPEPGSSVLTKLDSIVIPLIDFENLRLDEAIDYFRLRSIELDSEEAPEFRGVSILVNSPSSDELDHFGQGEGFRRIPRLQAKDFTLTQALVQTCEAADADAYITSIGIVVCPQGTPPFPNFKSESGEVWKKLTP